MESFICYTGGMVRILPTASFPDLRLAKLSVSQGRHLPCWEASGAIYHVTLHLADSVPQAQLEIWRTERARLTELARAAKRPLTDEEREALKAVYDERIEMYLAAGHGTCLLRDPRAAEALAKTILHDDGKLYAVHEWCIMPNHLHVIFGGLAEGTELRELLATWKRISAHRINKVHQREGEVWQRDSYSRIIRDRDEYAHQMSYVWNNPEAAGLEEGFLRERYTRG